MNNVENVVLALKAACIAHPSQRTMQVLVNAVGTDPFYMTDEEAAHALADYAMGMKLPVHP